MVKYIRLKLDVLAFVNLLGSYNYTEPQLFIFLQFNTSSKLARDSAAHQAIVYMPQNVDVFARKAIRTWHLPPPHCSYCKTIDI